MNNLSAFLAKLEKLDSKQGKRNVKEKDIIMGECVLVGGAMYSMGIHYVVARALPKSRGSWWTGPPPPKKKNRPRRTRPRASKGQVTSICCTFVLQVLNWHAHIHPTQVLIGTVAWQVGLISSKDSRDFIQSFKHSCKITLTIQETETCNSETCQYMASNSITNNSFVFTIRYVFMLWTLLDSVTCDAYRENLRQMAENDIVWHRRTTRANFQGHLILYWCCFLSHMLSWCHH